MSNDNGLSMSIKIRLLNLARENKRPFNDILQLYGIERFLYRLSCSAFSDQFVLKGALMLLVLDIPSFRPTRDIDLLGLTRNEIDNIVKIIKEICIQDVETPDGVVFDPHSIRAQAIREGTDNEGIRVRLNGYMGKARIPIQIDIGFFDVVTPVKRRLLYPTLLTLPAPEIYGYPIETIIAEKLQAMVFLGSINSRMKDYYDLWVLMNDIELEVPILQRAIKRTFIQRNTAIPDDVPECLSDHFAMEKQIQWGAFLKRMNIEQGVLDFSVVVRELREHLMPLLKTMENE